MGRSGGSWAGSSGLLGGVLGGLGGVFGALPGPTWSKSLFFKNVQKALVFQWFLKVFGLRNGAQRPSTRFESCPKGPRKIHQTLLGTQGAKTHVPKATKRCHQEPQNQAMRPKSKKKRPNPTFRQPPTVPVSPPDPPFRGSQAPRRTSRSSATH